MDTKIETHRKLALEAAKGLFYEKDVIEKIKISKSSFEIDRILQSARKNIEWIEGLPCSEIIYGQDV